MAPVKDEGDLLGWAMAHLHPPAHDDGGLVGGAGTIMAARYVAADCRGGRHVPITHSYATMMFSTRGTSQVEHVGRYRVSAGDVLLVPAGVPHRTIEVDGLESWGVAFCVACVAADAAHLLGSFERVRDGGSAVLRIAEERRDFLASLCAELEGAGRGVPSPSTAVVQQSLLTLILAEVDRASRHGIASAVDDVVVAGGGGVVVEALRLIERRCLGPLTVNEVARALGKTPSYVTTALRQATGRSANAWIVSGRMAEARRLLLHADEHIDVVAERVGYADATHFIRMFRREHDQTPAAWRAARLAPTRAMSPP